MKILLTNDDGIEAPGLEALCRAAAGLGELVVVAPHGAQSGCSHRVTTHEPLRIHRHLQGYAVEGTPADCIRVALHDLVPEADLVLSGINAGGNLGADVYHSGTVAAVREAVLHGIPGVALSQYKKRHLPYDWSRAVRWLTPLLETLAQGSWAPGVFWNINLPHLENSEPDPPVVDCPLDPSPLPLTYQREGDVWHYAGDYHGRVRHPGSDVDVCFRGQIARTRLQLP